MGFGVHNHHVATDGDIVRGLLGMVVPALNRVMPESPQTP
jgi:hypothetical protein